MKKTIMFIIMLTVCLLVVPSVYAEEVSEYAKVEDITNEDTLKTERNGVISGNETKTVTLTYSEGSFVILDQGGVTERPDDMAFVGIHITLPTGSKDINIKTLDPEHNDSMGTTLAFDKYFGFNAEDFEKATKGNNGVLTRTYVLTWKKTDDTEMTQTINIVIKPEKIAIFPEGDDAEDESKALWNEEKWSESVPKVKVTIVPVLDGKEIKLDDPTVAEIPVNYTFTSEDKDELNALIDELIEKDLKGSNIKFVGFYSDAKLKNKYDWTTKEANLTIYMAFETVKEETNPATGDNLLTYVSLSVVALTGALGTGLYLKKVNE